MKHFPIVVAVIAGFITPDLVEAQAPPFTPDKQYSADETITSANGSRSAKTYFDNGKIRTEMNANGMNMVSIMRLDQGKIYTLIPMQKMVMEMPLNSPLNTEAKQKMAAATGDDAKFELVGPDTINSIACIKYKATSSNGQVMFWWVNAADKTPVRVASPDGTMTIDFKNYKAGPQDASLFEPPAGYQVMQMPGTPGGMPGAAPGQ